MSPQTATQSNNKSQQAHEQTVVLLADTFSESGVKALEALGCKVVTNASLKN